MLRLLLTLRLFMAATAAVNIQQLAVKKTPAQIAPYPPMQWHSFGQFTGTMNEANMLEIAAALTSSGMVAAGYDTINIVCNGWIGRDPATGELLENRTLWPSGIRGFASKLHSMTPPLKVGCYTTPRTKNCMCSPLPSGGCEEGTGLGREAIDMAFFASAGCDHVMVDMPDGPGTSAAYHSRYRAIGEGIRASSNPDMLYGVWSGPIGHSYKWASDADVGGHYWRIGDDIYDGWQSLMRMWDTLQSIPNINQRTRQGAYTFLDQMLIGDVPGRHGAVTGPGLTYDETVSHMSLWVMAASPLLACTDVRNMTDEIKAVLTNPELLAIHKDPLVKMAVRVDVGGGHEPQNANLCTSNYPECQRLGPDDHGYHGPCQVCRYNISVWEKPLSDNSSAVMVLNRGDAPASATVSLYDLSDNTCNSWVVRDIWTQTDLGISTNELTVLVPAHGVRLLRMRPHTTEPTPPPPPPPVLSCPAGYQPHVPGGFWANSDPCPQHGSPAQPCHVDSINATVPACAAKCTSTVGCVAFEVFGGGSLPPSDQACYIFVDQMQPPFEVNANCFTCTRST